jgi:FAD:protein FMN transferase
VTTAFADGSAGAAGCASSPPRRQLLRVGWGVALGTVVGLPEAARANVDKLVWRETALPAFGTTVWMRAAHEDAARATATLTAAAQRVQAVEAQMSLFRDDSAIARLNRAGRLDDAPGELIAVLREALRIARASDGAFDPTVQPLWRVRFDAARQGRAAEPDAIARARALVGWRQVHVDEAKRRIAFARPGMAITLNGIAQGWATDAAAAVLREHGVEHALIDAGEWLPLGRSPDGGPWRLGVQDPRDAARIVATLRNDGRAVACSSDDKLAFTPDRREHHIVDPRTGRSPRELATVVVLAPACTLADALTKPMFMGSARDAITLARRWKVDVIVVDKAGRVTASGATPASKQL